MRRAVPLRDSERNRKLRNTVLFKSTPNLVMTGLILCCEKVGHPRRRRHPANRRISTVTNALMGLVGLYTLPDKNRRDIAEFRPIQ
jgi:hypothetical protein